MAIPNTIGSFPYPFENSPKREFLQFYASGGTVGALKVVPTNSTYYGKRFCLTKLNCGVTNATAGSTLVLKMAGDTILNIPATANNGFIVDFYPTFIMSQTLGGTISTPLLLVGGGASAVSYCFAQGFWK